MTIGIEDTAVTDGFAALSPDTIIEAIESQQELTCDGRLLALNSYENRVYRVGIEDSQPLIAKFYRPLRWTIEQISGAQLCTRISRCGDSGSCAIGRSGRQYPSPSP